MNRSILVGTRTGVIAQRLRERINLVVAIKSQLESVGEYSNDLIARQILELLCLPGKAFVDVGAHIGSVIDGVARHSRPSIIIAVEAIPTKVNALRRRFPHAIIHPYAVGEEDGELPFFIDTENSGYSSLHRREGVHQTVEIKVPVRRLDDLIGSEIVDVVKIDVEGAELAALKGGEKMIRRDLPTIMFESGPNSPGRYDKVDMWNWLESLGYAIIIPNRVAHHDPGLSCDGFVEAHLYPRRTTNYFAISRDRRDEIRLRARNILGFDRGVSP
jgi:FkbM family methyltransferase